MRLDQPQNPSFYAPPLFDQFVTCHERHALPAAEYFLMRNSLSDLRTVLVAGLDLETEAGRAELIAIHSAVVWLWI